MAKRWWRKHRDEVKVYLNVDEHCYLIRTDAYRWHDKKMRAMIRVMSNPELYPDNIIEINSEQANEFLKENEF